MAMPNPPKTPAEFEEVRNNIAKGFDKIIPSLTLTNTFAEATDALAGAMTDAGLCELLAQLFHASKEPGVLDEELSPKLTNDHAKMSYFLGFPHNEETFNITDLLRKQGPARSLCDRLPDSLSDEEKFTIVNRFRHTLCIRLAPIYLPKGNAQGDLVALRQANRDLVAEVAELRLQLASARQPSLGEVAQGEVRQPPEGHEVAQGEVREAPEAAEEGQPAEGQAPEVAVRLPEGQPAEGQAPEVAVRLPEGQPAEGPAAEVAEEVGAAQPRSRQVAQEMEVDAAPAAEGPAAEGPAPEGQAPEGQPAEGPAAEVAEEVGAAQPRSRQVAQEMEVDAGGAGQVAQEMEVDAAPAAEGPAAEGPAAHPDNPWVGVVQEFDNLRKINDKWWENLRKSGFTKIRKDFGRDLYGMAKLIRDRSAVPLGGWPEELLTEVSNNPEAYAAGLSRDDLAKMMYAVFRAHMAQIKEAVASLRQL